MQELIDRWAALEKMCNDCKSGYNGHCPNLFGWCKEYESILQVPTIEAEPVIHCEDCAFWESKRVSCEGLARCRTGESGYRYRFGHDFCSRAQKREEVSEYETD